MTKEKIALFWSGGKDSALALYRLLKEDKYQVVYLVTTINQNFKRISMHGVREELLDQQGHSLDIPLLKMYVDEASNSAYEKQLEFVFKKLKSENIFKVAFGDIFLEDLKEYRDQKLLNSGMQGIYPLWKNDTKKLIAEFLSLKFKTITCCVNDAYFSERDAGVEITGEWINNLPGDVDPCGENGEYHTFCYDGPIFKKPVKFTIGEKIYKPLQLNLNDDSPDIITRGFWFCDLIAEVPFNSDRI